MTEPNFTKLSISRREGVATVTISNPPVNVLDVPLMGEMRSFLSSVRDDPQTRVIVFESADPDFFIAHVDMTLIDEPKAFDELARDAPEGLNPFQAFGEMLRLQPQVTIIKLAGLARGGGAEFVAAADMAFAAEGRAGLAQCEALMGITPGGGATQYLSHRMTRDARWRSSSAPTSSMRRRPSVTAGSTARCRQTHSTPSLTVSPTTSRPFRTG